MCCNEHFSRCKAENWPAADTQYLKGNSKEFDVCKNKDFSKSTLVPAARKDRKMLQINKRWSFCLNYIGTSLTQHDVLRCTCDFVWYYVTWENFTSLRYSVRHRLWYVHIFLLVCPCIGLDSLLQATYGSGSGDTEPNRADPASRSSRHVRVQGIWEGQTRNKSTSKWINLSLTTRKTSDKPRLRDLLQSTWLASPNYQGHQRQRRV